MIATAATQPIHVFHFVDMDRDGKNVNPGSRDPGFLLSRGLLHAASEPTVLTSHVLTEMRFNI